MQVVGTASEVEVAVVVLTKMMPVVAVMVAVVVAEA